MSELDCNCNATVIRSDCHLHNELRHQAMLRADARAAEQERFAESRCAKGTHSTRLGNFDGIECLECGELLATGEQLVALGIASKAWHDHQASKAGN